MATDRALGKLILTVFVCVFISGCQASELRHKIEWVDKKLGDILQQFKAGPLPETASKTEAEKSIKSYQELTLAERKKIEQWLKDNGLNKYGDPEGTIYPGGTPLFNEKSGGKTDRYKYILEHHPKILENLK